MLDYKRLGLSSSDNTEVLRAKFTINHPSLPTSLNHQEQIALGGCSRESVAVEDTSDECGKVIPSSRVQFILFPAHP